MKIIKSSSYKELKNENDLLEELSGLEHEQWMHWAKEILKEEMISEERGKRWKKDFIPYRELAEKTKDFDREWAKKVINIIKKYLKKNE